MSAAYWLLGNQSTAYVARKGVVRSNRKVVYDDTGVFHPLGLTFFWALYGWKFERSRVVAHLDWIAKTFGPDYLRILCEVDWVGRSILLSWPDYTENLQGFVDYAYDRYGIRTQLTLVGGAHADHMGVARRVVDAMQGRAHKVMLYEMVNEWQRLDKATIGQLINMAQYVRTVTPNLVALSAPRPKTGESTTGINEMILATMQAGANAYVVHPRRTDYDLYWDPVSQGYDMRLFPSATFDNEPQGLQSSVDAHTEPVHLVADRVTSVQCGAAGYCLHVGQGVTGIADPTHHRPQNMWEVPGIEEVMRLVREADAYLPLGVENWAVRNNFRNDHPFPVEVRHFWPERGNTQGIYKNYAAVNGADFALTITGVRGPGFVFCGKALDRCDIQIIDLRTGTYRPPVLYTRGSYLYLSGREDSLQAYAIVGRYV